MRKRSNSWIKMLALLLCAALLLGLAACGGKDKTDDDKKEEDKKEDVAEKKDEFVYVAEYIPVKYDAQNGLTPMVFTDEYIYASSYEKIGDNTPEGVIPEYEGQYWEWGTVLYRVDWQGNCEKIPYTPTPREEGLEGSNDIAAVCPGKDGNLVLLERVYTYWMDEMPEGVEEYSDEYWQLYEQAYHYEEKFYIRTIAPDGTAVSSVELTNPSGEDGYFYPYSFQADDEGNYYVPCDAFLYVFDDTGALIASIEAENWVEGIVRLQDGSMAVGNYGSNGFQLSRVDLVSKTFTENIPLPVNVYGVLPGAGEYDICYNNGSSYYGYDFETQTSTKILSWINCDIDGSNIGSQNVNLAEDGTVTAVLTEWKDGKSSTEIVKLSKKPASSVPEKKIIRLATQYLNYNVRSKIIEFNKTNGEYRIEVTDYSEYNTEQDYNAGTTKLTTEILSGNVPDILWLEGLPVEQLASKGYLEDLYPYLDSDSQLSREDLFPSVLSALEQNGKLYSTCANFTIRTVMGASSVVGDEPGWTVDEYLAALATMPEGCTGFDQYMVQGDMLRNCLNLDLASFINWETGECNFNSEGFVQMLEFANSFPKEFDWDNYEYTEADDLPNRLASGRQMLYATEVYDFQEFQMYKAIFGGAVTFIGYPTAFGTGNMMRMDSGYAMSSKCEYKEGAWQFMRQFFTEDYQEEYSWSGFPTNINAFNTRLEQAMTPIYRKDENGNFVLDENGNKIEESQGGYGWGSVSIEMYAIKQEEADQILDLINSTTKVYNYDEEIIDLIVEQTAPYFAGQKSAQDVAKLVQSKISLYVNESL